MFGFLANFLWILLTGVASIGGFVCVRRFVKGRMRYVDALQRPYVPLAAGVGAALVAAPLVGVLPIVGGASAALFGVGVGLGVASGRKEIKQLTKG